MEQFGLSERRACRLVELDRSSYRYEPRPDHNARGTMQTLRCSRGRRTNIFVRTHKSSRASQHCRPPSLGWLRPDRGRLVTTSSLLRRWLPDQWASLHRYRTSGIRKRDPLCPSRPTRIGQERANWRKSCAFSRTISTNASGIWACCPHQTAKRACRTLN